MSEVISKDALCQLVDAWISQGKQAVGPKRVKADLVQYANIDSADQLLWDGFIHPANSLKQFFLPVHEKLYGYRFKGKEIELFDMDTAVPEQLIIGARPCDAAALPILDHIFNWDYKDEFYNRRREASTIVTLACKEHDDYCFCTSVGLAPDAEKGSDVLLVDLGDGNFEVRCLTDKGRALLADKVKSSDKTGEVPCGPAEKFDTRKIKSFLESDFEHPIWQEQTLRCLGCAVCAYTCPTCHCFDIVDEGNAAGGYRVRNWDACQFTMFTLHASGHNPRESQPQRQRQRIYHKFHIYPEKFAEILCTGCGNCSRNCPTGLGVLPVLKAVDRAGSECASEVENAEHL